jgi:hypothetical protein
VFIAGRSGFAQRGFFELDAASAPAVQAPPAPVKF